MIPHKKIGTIGEAKTLAKFSEYGIDCYLPFNENTKSDIIADINGKLTRIQIKTSNQIDHNSLVVSIRQSGNKEVYSNTDVDYFVIYNMIDDELYMITFDDIKNSIGKSISIKIRYTRAVHKDTLQNKDIMIDDVLTRDLGLCKISSSECSCSVRKPKEQECKKKSKCPSKEELINLLTVKGVKEIADIFDVTGQTIRKWCRTLDIDIAKYTSAVYVEKTCALCGKKFMTKDKSKKFCSKECADNRGLLHVDLDEVKRMYFEEHKSMREIGRRFGVHHKLISRFLKKLESNDSVINELTKELTENKP